MTTTISPTTSRTTLFSRRGLILFAAIATGIDLLIYAVGKLAGAPMLITSQTAPISVVTVIIASFVPLVVGGLLVWLIVTRAPRLRPWATWVGFGIALASLVFPFQEATTVSTGIALAAMHPVIAAAWLVTSFTRSKS